MLTNELRKAFGMKELLPEWSQVPLKGMEDASIYYDENRILQKFIKNKSDEIQYSEKDYFLPLDEELRVIGKRGKVQKLSYSVLKKFKPASITLLISPQSISLINWKNGIQLFQERGMNFRSREDVLELFNHRLTKQTEFEKDELERFLNSGKQKPQKFNTGDIFRYKLAERRFAYGRVICDLRKFLNYKVPSDKNHEVDFRGETLFNTILYPPVWVDYFVLITENPHLRYDDLKSIPTTYSIINNAHSIIDNHYTIVDHTDIEVASFDVPMSWDTYYQYVPITQIFKWGPSVKLFNPDARLEKEREKAYPMNYRPIYMKQKEGTEYFIRSFINGKPDFRSTTFYGDLREELFAETRKLLSENIGFDIDSRDYDAYATKYGYMTKKEILRFCE